MKTDLISIVMPVYNGERYIEQAIRSVLSQTYEKWELIIVDDCSKDRTKEVIQSFVNMDSRVTLLYNTKNRGVAKSRQKAISMAKGVWIAFLDCDDRWEKSKLEEQLDMAKHNDAKFIFTASGFMDSMGKKSDFIMQVPTVVSYSELLKQNIISCSSVMIDKELLSQYPIIDGPFHEDYLLWLKILKDGNIAVGINEPLLIYRLSSESKSGNKVKAARMTYQVYRQIGLNRIYASYYWLIYVFRSISKYIRI